MKKLKSFLENYGKIIEFFFSVISLLIVGVVGTTISINNSMMSKTSLELSKAQSQPIFAIKCETTDEEKTEILYVDVDSGFAENVTINADVILRCKDEDEIQDETNNYLIYDYFLNEYYSGNNRGQVLNAYSKNNLKKFISFYQDGVVSTNPKFKNVKKEIFISINYKNVTGENCTKYYLTINKESVNGTYFTHIDEQDANQYIELVKKIKTISINELTIENVENK